MALALAVVGALTSAVGTYVQAQASAQANEYNAAVADINAKTARQQAGADAREKRRDRNRLMGQIRNQVGGNGIQTTGSVLDVANDSFLSAYHDEKMIAYQGEVRGTDYENRAEGFRSAAKNDRIAGRIGVVSDLVGGAGKALKLA